LRDSQGAYKTGEQRSASPARNLVDESRRIVDRAVKELTRLSVKGLRRQRKLPSPWKSIFKAIAPFFGSSHASANRGAASLKKSLAQGWLTVTGCWPRFAKATGALPQLFLTTHRKSLDLTAHGYSRDQFLSRTDKARRRCASNAISSGPVS
jgi:hypothetical protein